MSENTQINVSTTTEIVNVDVTETLQPVSLECFFANGSAQDTVVNVSENVLNIDLNVTETQAQNVTVDVIYPTGAQGPKGESLWGTISGTLSTQTDLWRYLSGETFSPSQLTAFLNSNAISLCSINTKGQILSAGIPLHNIFLTSETDSQILSYIPSSYLLSISNGNTVNLSSINSTFVANSGKYESVYTNAQSNSANWSNAYNIGTTYQNASGSFLQASIYQNTSGTFLPTTVFQIASTGFAPSNIYQSLTSNWETAYNQSLTLNQYLPLSGGNITGDLSITGNISGVNTRVFFNAGSATGFRSFATNTGQATGSNSFAEGNNTSARGSSSHAEGLNSIASGTGSHAEGNTTIASGIYAHAQGSNTEATGLISHAMGSRTKALGEYAFAGGRRAVAKDDYSYVWATETGSFEVSSTRVGQYLISASGGMFIPSNVGIGTDSIDNALTVVGTISTSNHGNSNLWNSAYTLVQSNSSSWEESADIIPTVTNYLSTNNVFISAAIVTDGLLINTIQVGGRPLNNIFIGTPTNNNITGNHNFAFGTNAGRNNSTGSSNNFFGCYAGRCNSTGGYNNFFGTNAGFNNSTGDLNNFFGLNAGRNNCTGSSNNFFGFNAGHCNTTGGLNNFFGDSAGRYNSSGNSNNFFGFNAGFYNTTGGSNNFFGRYAGLNNSTGGCNNFFGDYAGLYNSTGNSNNFFGPSAGRCNSTGGSNNFFGPSAGLCNSTGCSNNFFGSYAGRNNSTGNSNNFFGPSAGRNNTTGGSNNFFGNNAGCNNITGSSNIIIGTNTNVATSNLSGVLVLGTNAIATESNQIVLNTGNNRIATQGNTLNIGQPNTPNNLTVVGDISAIRYYGDGSNLIGINSTLSSSSVTLSTTTLNPIAILSSTPFITSRVLQDKLGEVISVKDFGARGDGITNDWLPIQRTLSAAAGVARVYIPQGLYLISQELRIPSNSYIYGAGIGTTVIKLSSTANATQCVMTNSQNTRSIATNQGNENITIKDLELDGNVSRFPGSYSPVGDTSGTGLCFAYVRNALVERVSVHDTCRHCFDIGAPETSITLNPLDYVPNPSFNIHLKDIIAYGAGDDNITTHFSHNIIIENAFVPYTGGTEVPTNSNGIEIDDGCYDITIIGGYIKNCRRGLEIKGHSWAPAAKRVKVYGLTVENCTRNFGIRHLGFDNIDSKTAFDISLYDCTSIAPVSSTFTTDGPRSLQISNYDGVYIKDFRVIGEHNATRAVTIQERARNIKIDGMTFTQISGAVTGITEALLYVDSTTQRNVTLQNIIFRDCQGLPIYIAGSIPGVVVDGVDAFTTVSPRASSVVDFTWAPTTVPYTVKNVSVSGYNYAHTLGGSHNFDYTLPSNVGLIENIVPSSPASVNTQYTVAKLGWREGTGQSLNAGIGVRMDFTSNIFSGVSAGLDVPVAYIGTRKVNGTDSDITSNLTFGTLSANDATLQDRMSITPAGLVGINTTTPNERLTVVGNISATGIIFGTLAVSSTNLTGTVSASGPFVIGSNVTAITGNALQIRGGNVRIDGVDLSNVPNITAFDTDGQSLFDLRSASPSANYNLSIASSGVNNFMKFFGGRDGDAKPFIVVKTGQPLRFASYSNFFNTGNDFTEYARVDTAAGNVCIGGGNSTVALSAAILQLDSTTKGFLPPRMTTSQRNIITTPPTGLIIYNTTTNLINYYAGNTWVALATATA